MSTATKRVPLIDLPSCKRELGTLQVDLHGKKCALPLAGVDISARVADRVASVTVKQTFRNTYSEHLEAVYIFPLSGGCVVSDFELRVGTRIVKGVVQERKQARIEYQKALQEGKRAALLEQERDDVFTMQVGNIPPNEEVSVTVIYSERLPYFESGKTELRLPLVVAPRYIPGEAVERDNVGEGAEADTDRVPDASRISPPRLVAGHDPGVALNIEVEIAGADGASVSDLVCSQHATQLGIDAGALRIELARDDERLNRDFVLQWRAAVAAVRSSLLVYKKEDGKQYGMLSITPPKRDGYVGAPRDVVFVLDRSGSMGGIKMTSAARACSILLETLGPNDRFAIQAFDTVVEWLTLPGLQGWDSRWVDADEAGLERGNKFLRSIDARGGTEMLMASIEAFEALAHRQNYAGRVPVVVLLTDGEVGNESEILRQIQNSLGEARLFAVGIDTAANTGLLRRLANLGGGTAAFVAPGTDLENALRSIGREIGAPMITDIELISDGSAIEKDSVSPERIADLFDGRAVTAFMQLTGKGSIRVRGKWSDGKVFEEKVKTQSVSVPAVAQLWAKSVITDLEDQFRVNAQGKIRQRIIDLSVAHSVLAKFTAFVAVDHAEVVNKDGKLRQVVQPVEMPDQWELQADASLPARQASSLMGQLSRARGSTGGLGAPSPQPRAKMMNSQLNSLSLDDGLMRECEGVAETTGSWGAASSGGSSSGDAWSAPAPGSAPPPPAAPPAQSAGGGGNNVIGKMKQLGNDLGNMLFGSNEPVDELSVGDKLRAKAEAHQSKKYDNGAGQEIVAKYERFVEVMNLIAKEIESGALPTSQLITDFEAARKNLLEALTQSVAGTKVPLLQKFLRSAALELVESLKQTTGTAAALQPLWERHMQSFHSAQVEATTQLLGSSSASPFWEASV